MRPLTKYLIVIATLMVVTGFAERAQTQDTRKLGNNVVLHIAFVVRDVEKSARTYADLFGVDVPKASLTDPLEKTNIQFNGKPTTGRAKLAFLRLENITVELIEPVGGPSSWQEFLQKRGEGVHHIAFKVKGMDEDIARLERKGGRMVQRGDFTGGSYSYVDLTKQLGVIVELLTFKQDQ
jgi:catechol 2,3-dioxygenase-like lactoylglutathione lyase family enzyme